MKILLPLFILIAAVPAFSQTQTLTNESIIEMANAGIPASVIISKIKASTVSFETGTPELKALVDAKVPDAVISAMIDTIPQRLAARVKPEPDKPRPASPQFVTFESLDKESRKLRIKSVPTIGIAAPTETVQSLMIRALQTWNYQIESESPRAILFSKPVTGIGNQMLVGMAMGGNNMMYKVQVSMSEYEGVTSVIVSAWVTSDNAFGKTNQESLDRNKKWRSQLDELLKAVKIRAESTP